ncbi:unnamed protein product, partial [Symbiodinium necroappetens]
LRLQPANLVLVGDHKQLPPTSLVQPQILEGTGHNRSLLERCVLASGRVHQLREQYRMHPSIGRLVSNLFYSGRLETPRRVAEDRQACERRPLVWMDVQGREEAPNKSYINAAEVNSCLKVVTRLRERIGPKPSVALLTFYKGQLEELMKAVPSDLDVEVLTVDACQGSEFDFVILSTVRANRDLRLGFVKDAQRICVATSRSRLQLFIVGHRQTLCADGDWKQVYEACTAATPEDARPQRPSPAAGFVSVFDALRRAKELDAEQKALQAMEEQSKDPGRRPSRPSSGAESLMWQQASFRNQASQPSILRRNDGTYQSSTAVAIGGGYRSRRDVYAMEATAKAHLQSLEAAFKRRSKPSDAYTRRLLIAVLRAGRSNQPCARNDCVDSSDHIRFSCLLEHLDSEELPGLPFAGQRLPKEILNIPTVTAFGKTLSLQECISMSFILGFGAAKIPAMRLATSGFFFRHRLALLVGILVSSMLLVTLPILLLEGWEKMQVLGVFTSSFISSFLYGGIVTYLEGRQSTEIMLAAISASLTVAGTLSRAAATALLDWGVAPRLMPLLLGGCCCILACISIVITDRSPRPSGADVAARSARAAMSSRQQWDFVSSHAFGVIASISAWAGLVGLRSFRDFYAKQVFTAALGEPPTPKVLAMADLPGAATSFVALVMMSWVKNSQKALRLMLVLCASGLLLVVALTWLLRENWLDGISWMLLYSAAFYTSFSMLNAPINERIFAVTRAEGTCSFLIFASDGAGYVVTIGLLMYQSFGPLSATDATDAEVVLQLFVQLLYILTVPIVCVLLLSVRYFSRSIYTPAAGAAL